VKEDEGWASTLALVCESFTARVECCQWLGPSCNSVQVGGRQSAPACVLVTQLCQRSMVARRSGI
jgi:hypothetical protein